AVVVVHSGRSGRDRAGAASTRSGGATVVPLKPLGCSEPDRIDDGASPPTSAERGEPDESANEPDPPVAVDSRFSGPGAPAPFGRAVSGREPIPANSELLVGYARRPGSGGGGLESDAAVGTPPDGFLPSPAD